MEERPLKMFGGDIEHGESEDDDPDDDMNIHDNAMPPAPTPEADVHIPVSKKELNQQLNIDRAELDVIKKLRNEITKGQQRKKEAESGGCGR